MSIIASSSDELKFHHWPEGHLKFNYLPPNYTDGPIKTISWGKDGNWIAIVPCLGAAEVISIKDNVKVLQTIQNVYHPTCAAFQNTTKRNIAMGTLSGQVLVYDIKLRNVKKRFPRATSPILDLRYNSRDSHIVAACANGDILLYNHLTTNLSSLYKVPKSNSVSTINFHRSKRNLLVGGSNEGMVATWDINTNQILCEILAHHAPVTDTKFSPMRDDLIVTGGLDRRFAYYDLAAKKCIIEVEVSSSTTSLDFSSCGTYLGLGSHNGNIIVYDTRNFRKPISAFVGHEGKQIHHLFFQKVINNDSDSGDSSFDMHCTEESAVKGQESEVTSDSLGLITCDVSTNQADQKSPQQEDDSFLVALGLNNNSNICEMSASHENSNAFRTIEEETKVIDESKRLQSTVENVIVTKTPMNIPKQISSTPKYLIDTVPPITVSPVVGPVTSGSGYNMDELKQMIKDSVREQVEAQMSNIKENIKEEFQSQMSSITDLIKMEFWDSHSQIRRHFLDLHMSIVKQFIQMESKISAINQTTVREFVCDDFLIKRNEELMREVMLLREKIADTDHNHRKF